MSDTQQTIIDHTIGFAVFTAAIALFVTPVALMLGTAIIGAL